MRRDAGNVDSTGSQVYEEQNVVRHQPALSPHFRGEKICCREDVHVRADELPPRRGLTTLWCERNAVAFQNVTDGLIGYFMPEVG